MIGYLLLGPPFIIKKGDKSGIEIDQDKAV